MRAGIQGGYDEVLGDSGNNYRTRRESEEGFEEIGLGNTARHSIQTTNDEINSGMRCLRDAAPEGAVDVVTAQPFGQRGCVLVASW